MYEILIALVLDLGLLSLCTVFIAVSSVLAPPRYRSSVTSSKMADSSLFGVFSGLAFGATCAFLVLFSKEFNYGSIVDLRAAPAIVSGIVGGPIAAAITMIMGAAARLHVGGPFVVGGMFSLFFYAASGLLFARLLNLNMKIPSLKTVGTLGLVGVLSTFCVLPAFFLDQDFSRSMSAAQLIWPALIVHNPVGVVILGGTVMIALHIFHDKEKLAQLTEELSEANLVLEGENRKLWDFSAIAAHDLIAPLVRIETLMQFSKEDLKDSGTQMPAVVQEYMREIEKSTNAMKCLVKDLVRFSLSEEDTGEAMDFAPSDRIPTILTQVAVPSSFSVSVPGILPQVHAPPPAFDIVLRNLLSNAINHHDRAAGIVKLTSRIEKEHLHVDVSDDGPGFEKCYEERVFEPFERLDPGSTDGSGLGLSLVRKLVTAWGGDVFAHCNNERGATFSFTIPLSNNQLQSAA